jgi:glyoxylase I family protein
MPRIKYIVNDVDRAITFYTKTLGFELDRQDGPVFGIVSKGDFTQWLSGPQSTAARPMPDGRRRNPAAGIDSFCKCIAFRNEIVVGPGGKQILVQDEDGNLVELFEPASPVD